MPKVTIILPVRNSVRYLTEALDSIKSQSFQDWDLLAIHEFDSNDGSLELLETYRRKERRIQIIENTEKLGLARSLNLGIQRAEGEYIARMDADDISAPTRLEKQVALMDSTPRIGACGTYQHHFGSEIDWIHKPPITPEECRANFLFDCDICHSTMMLRKKVFIENHLFYDPSYLAEDYELWTRAVRVTEFTNIPEVLGEYRWEGNNITISKKEKLAKENAIIVANALKRNLDLEIPKEDYMLLEGWGNPFLAEKNKTKRKKMYQRYQEILKEIYRKNKEIGFYEEKALLGILASQWRYVRYLEPRNIKREVNSIEEILDPHYIPDYKNMWKCYLSRKKTVSARIKTLYKFIRKKWS